VLEVRGSVEAFSTMHKAGGLMEGILKAEEGGRKDEAGRKIFAWCVWDVIAKCPEERKCEGCGLWEGCGGRAKGASGFVPVEDVVAMKGRVSRATWEHEMLCRRPRVEHGVFPAFSRATHVRSADGYPLCAGARLVLDARLLTVESVVAGVDFGYRGAFVCLWMAMMRVGTKPDGLRVLWVMDEMVTREQTVVRNAMAMRDRRWDPVKVYCDIAGRETNSQTGRTDERVLRDEGFSTRAKSMLIGEGVSMIADLVDPAMGFPRLYIDPRCAHLITAMESYEKGADGKPIKDGVHDHLIDALRYALVGHDYHGAKVEVRYY